MAGNLELWTLFRGKVPARDGIGEIFRVFVLRKDDLRLDPKNAAIGSHQDRLDVATIFGIVNFGELPPNGAISDFFGGTLENYGLVCFFGPNDHLGKRRDVFGLARARTGAEPEGILPPDAPNQHEVRATVGPRGGYPIVMGLFEAL